MLFPDLMPEELAAYQKTSNTEELYDLLIKNRSDLLLFFEAAADDETWSEKHESFMKRLLEWMTEQQYADRLDHPFCMRAAKLLQKHEQLLQPLLPENIQLQFKDKTVKANSLLLSVLSPFFQSALISKKRDEGKLSFVKYDYEQFVPFEQFMRKGEIPHLYRFHLAELFVLLEQASLWGVRPIIWESQQALVKYISQENVSEWLQKAHKEQWDILKQKCVDFINSLADGFSLYVNFPERLGFALKSFEGNTEFFFHQYGAFITDLSLPYNLSEDPRAAEFIVESSHLVRLDLSRSDALGLLLPAIPPNLEALDLSECPWLKPGMLKQFADLSPSLKQLSLCGDTHLNYAIWGELHHFAKLQRLDLSRCHQISSSDFKVILKACPPLLELALDDCSGIDEEGFSQIGKFMPLLESLSMVNCAITDRALADIADQCQSLKMVDLSRCRLITERGVKRFARQRVKIIGWTR